MIGRVQTANREELTPSRKIDEEGVEPSERWRGDFVMSKDGSRRLSLLLLQPSGAADVSRSFRVPTMCQ